MATAAQIKKSKQVLSTARMEKGLSIKALLKSTPAYYKNKAKDEIVIKKYNPNARTKGGHAAATAICKNSAVRGSTAHRCSVIGMDKEVSLLSKQKRVKVSCDCEDFCFTWEYALMTWGAASIKYSNGEPAVMKNAGNIAGACKHLCAVMKLIIERGE